MGRTRYGKGSFLMLRLSENTCITVRLFMDTKVPGIGEKFSLVKELFVLVRDWNWSIFSSRLASTTTDLISQPLGWAQGASILRAPHLVQNLVPALYLYHSHTTYIKKCEIWTVGWFGLSTYNIVGVFKSKNWELGIAYSLILCYWMVLKSKRQVFTIIHCGPQTSIY